MIEIHFSGGFKSDLQSSSDSRSLTFSDSLACEIAATEEVAKIVHEVLSVALRIATDEDEHVDQVILEVLALAAVRSQLRTEAQLAFVKAAQEVADRG